MWVWQESVVTSAAESAALFDFAVKHDVDTLYVHAFHVVTDNQAKLGAFIDTAAKSGISVELLFGDSCWIFPSPPAECVAQGSGGSQVAIDKAKAAVAFAKATPSVKPTAVHFDVEPHAAQGWDANNVAYSNLYLDVLDQIAAIVKGSGLHLNVDAGHFYAGVSVPRKGTTKSLIEWILADVDMAMLMAYRDHATGSNSTVSIIMDEFALGPASGKKLGVGVETSCGLDPTTTYCGKTPAQLEAWFTDVRAAYGTNSAFGQLAVHDHKAYKVLSP